MLPILKNAARSHAPGERTATIRTFVNPARPLLYEQGSGRRTTACRPWNTIQQPFSPWNSNKIKNL